MQKITTGPFANPYRSLIQTQRYDTKANSHSHNNSNKNRNHILTTVNNGGGAGSASNNKNHNQSENNYNNHAATNNCKPPAPLPPHYNPRRPSFTAALSAGGGATALATAGTVSDIDVVDNSNCLPSPRTVQDVHTPSESNSETLSSSEQSSSSGEEWESGELTSEQIFDSSNINSSTVTTIITSPTSDNLACSEQAYNVECGGSGKEHQSADDDHNPYYSDDNYYYGSSLAGTRILSQRKKFKAKVTNSNPTIDQKMRWLANMRSDPDFAETLKSNVQFRSPSSNDSLNSDYYSSMCDKQLSFGSPCKSPGELVRMAVVAENAAADDCSDIVVATKTPQLETGFIAKQGNEPCKSPSKTDIFKARFFSFAKRDNATATSALEKSEPSSGPIPLITIDASHCSSAATTKHNSKEATLLSTQVVQRPNRCTPFSFREIRQEIQSALRNSTSGSTTTKLKEKK